MSGDEYRIVVPVIDEPRNEEILASLAQRAARPAAILAAGSRDALERLSPFRSLGAMDRRLHTETLGALIARMWSERPQDLLVVSPRVVVPPLFDLRLHWSAYSDDQVAAVSPVCDLDSATSLERFRIEIDDPVEADAFLSEQADKAVVDAPHCPIDCVYLRCDLLRGASGLEHVSSTEELFGVLRRQQLVAALAPHVYVGVRGICARPPEQREDPVVEAFLAESPLHDLARTYIRARQEHSSSIDVVAQARPGVLHVAHSFGGGLDRWVRVFTDASRDHDTFVLRSVGERGRYGSQLWLYDDPGAARPLRTWQLETPIAGTAVRHLGYKQVITEIVETLGLDAVVVSSLIGHSLDALETGLPTAFVCHDYYPFCPALHIEFGEVCRRCEGPRLAACLRDNPLNTLFDGHGVSEWMVLRRELVRRILAHGVRMVAPSASVVTHYRRLMPEVRGVPIAVIPHGTAADLDDARHANAHEEESHGLLQVLVLGRLTRAKGAELFPEVHARTCHLARFHLVGCGDAWASTQLSGVTILPSYARQELPEILRSRHIDTALLLSMVPETFSFTLDECFRAGIPPIAAAVGSMADRIDDGYTGMLCEPTAESFANRLRVLARDRRELAAIRDRLGRLQLRSAAQMVNEYERLLGLPEYSARGYFSPGRRLWRRRRALAPATTELPLPSRSAIGFGDFLEHVEQGTYEHLSTSQALRPWQRTAARRAARMGFHALRWASRRVAAGRRDA